MAKSAKHNIAFLLSQSTGFCILFLSFLVSAEIPPANYESFTSEQRCSDFQKVVKSWMKLSEAKQCGKNLSKWKSWVDSNLQKERYQWCLQQSAETLNQLKVQLQNDLFSDLNKDFSVKPHDGLNLCRYGLKVFDLLDMYSAIKDGDRGYGKSQPFQNIPEDVAEFIILNEAKGVFRRSNPEQRLYPDRPRCEFKGALTNLSSDKSVEQWVVVPNDACWDRRRYLETRKLNWLQRFWIVERAKDESLRLVLEDSGNFISLRASQTNGYYDFYLTSFYPSTLPSHQYLDPVSLAQLKKNMYKRDLLGDTILKRFQYNSGVRKYESPDGGAWFYNQ